MIPITRLFARSLFLWMFFYSALCAVRYAAADSGTQPAAGMIYFVADSPTQGQNTFALDPVTLTRFNLTEAADIQNVFVVSPDGETIAFRSETDSAVEIRIFDYATARSKPIFSVTSIDPSYQTDVTLYSWSPSGRYLAFGSNGRLFKFDFRTRATSPIVHEDRVDGFNDVNPAWSPDESAIVFASSSRDSITWQLYRVNVDGSQLRRITHDDCSHYQAAWSPVSHWLAVDTGCNGSSDIDLLDAETGTLKPIVALAAAKWAAAWSPSGDHLLFTAGTDKTDRAIYIVDANGSAPHRLIEGNSAYWSPDGSQILFNTLSGRTLYVVNANGTNQRRVAYVDDATLLAPITWSSAPQNRSVLFSTSLLH